MRVASQIHGFVTGRLASLPVLAWRSGIALAIVMAFLASGCAAKPEPPQAALPTIEAPKGPAPFGLDWGMQISALTARDIPVQSQTKSGNLTVVTVTETPQTLEDTYLVSLLFDAQQGLVKVRWIGNDVEGDATGKLGRRKYAEVRKFVVETYGEPADEALVIGTRLFDQDDEFYQCLRYEGCGIWSAIWEQDPSGGILLSIEGVGPGNGFVQVDFESDGWQTAIERYQ